MNRCDWALGHPLLMAYHDEEWGVFTQNRQRLFELLILEGAQAGLSWLSILKRRSAYRAAFLDFNPDKVAAWEESAVEPLLENTGLIRNRAKLKAAWGNARAFLLVEETFSGFDKYLLDMTGGPVIHHYETVAEVPAWDSLSQQLSRDLLQRGFKFVGPTICYSYLQATGLIMDHLISCFRYPVLGGKGCG